MKRRRWIQTALAAPAAALGLAEVGDAQPTRSEFEKVETTPSLERAGEPVRKFFSKEEFEALARLANAILPPLSGKPGAIEAGVPSFLDFLIAQSPAPRQKLYREGLAHFNSASDLDALLKPLSVPWTYREPADPFHRFLRAAKEDILEAAFNSREWIAAQEGRRRGSGTYYLAVE